MIERVRQRVDARARRVSPRGVDLLEELVHEWRTDRVGGLAAEVAFFGMLSLFPALLALAATLSSLDAITGVEVADRAEARVVDVLDGVLGSEAGGTIGAVSDLFDQSSPGLLTISVVLAIWAASRAFAALIRALDLAYDLPEHRTWLRLRAVALGLALGSVLVVALLLTMLIVGPLLGTGRAVADRLGLGEGFVTFWTWMRWPVVVVVVLAWVTTVFHVAPNHATPWRWDLPGAVVGAAGWILASVAFRTYLGVAGEANQVFGLLGGGLIALMWFYLLAVSVLLGAEVNAMVAHHRHTGSGSASGNQPVPAEGRRTTRRRLLSGRIGARLTGGNHMTDEPENDASSAAMQELAELIAAIEVDSHHPRWNFTTLQDRASYREFAMHSLHHALQFWLEADPLRPWFHRWFSPTLKLLGDNPDTVYYGTVVDPTRTYRLRGNTANACYTSFTVELGTAGGAMSRSLGHTLNDTEFDVDAAGGFELIVGPDEPASGPRNWLRLDPDAGSITTRHYFEWERCVALDPGMDVPLSIVPLDDPGPPPVPDDEATAANIRRAITFLRSVTVDWGHTPMPPGTIPWVSAEPNVFTNPPPDDGNLGIGYAAADNVYRSSRWQLGPDEALVITGRFPRCRFANIVLFNNHMQTPNYDRRLVSLNRVQTVHEPDGSFRMVLAHRDPGVANWLDTRGLPHGTMFWRFLLPDEPLHDLHTEVVAFDSL